MGDPCQAGEKGQARSEDQLRGRAACGGGAGGCGRGQPSGAVFL